MEGSAGPEEGGNEPLTRFGALLLNKFVQSITTRAAKSKNDTFAMTSNPGDRLEMLDSQRPESIMRDRRGWEYHAAPVGISQVGERTHQLFALSSCFLLVQKPISIP